MVLYHATHKDNQDWIDQYGLEPSISDKISNAEERISRCGVYGFLAVDVAKNFGVDNYCSEYVVFAFEINETDFEVMVDPEYDGEAMFVETQRNIKNVYIIEE